MSKSRKEVLLLNAEAVRRIIKARGTTQGRVSSQTGIDESQFRKWLNRPQRKITRGNAEIIANHLNCTVKQLTGEEPFVVEDRANQPSDAKTIDPEKESHVLWLFKTVTGILGLPSDKLIVYDPRQNTIRFLSLLLFGISIVAGILGNLTIGLLAAVMGLVMGGASLVFASGAKKGYALAILATSLNSIAAATYGTIIINERVTPGPQSIPADDRNAAMYILSIGGTLRVQGNDAEIKAEADLPAGPFQLTHIILADNNLLNDAGLAHFKDCNNLTHLELDRTRVSNAGMTYFKGLNSLDYLGLGDTQVTSEGLANFKDCTDLTYIGLFNTRVDDDGIAYFKNCKKLIWLQLGVTQISDKGLSQFHDCKNLKKIEVTKTKVTLDGIAELQKALPKCKIITMEEQ